MVSLCCDSQERDLNFLRSKTLELAQGNADNIHKTAIVRDLQAMHSQCEPHRVLDQSEQIIFGPGTIVNVEVYLYTAEEDVKLGFDGYVGEPAGQNLSFSPLVDP